MKINSKIFKVGLLLLLTAEFGLYSNAFSQTSSSTRLRYNADRRGYIVADPQHLINPVNTSGRTPYRPPTRSSLLTLNPLAPTAPVVYSTATIDQLKANSWAYLQRFISHWGVRNLSTEFPEANFQSRPGNRSMITYPQKFSNTLVFGGGMKTMLGPTGQVYHFSGHYLEVPLSFSVSVSGDSKEKSKRKATNDLFGRYNLTHLLTYSPSTIESMFSEPVLYIYNEPFVKGKRRSQYLDPSNYKLVWFIRANVSPEISEEFLIDARSYTIIRNIEAVLHTGGSGNGYDIEPVKIYNCATGCACPLVRSGPGAPLSGNPDSDKAYDYINRFRGYLYGEFGLYGPNNHGGLGDGSMYPLNESRAQTNFNGCISSTCTALQARYVPATRELRFCGGTVGGDIVGHEMFHATVANQQISIDGSPSPVLLSEGEGGAIHEALADIFGEDFDTYLVSGTYDWRTGTGTAMTEKRSFSNPGNYYYRNIAGNYMQQYPETYDSTAFYCGTEDAGGVHRNSTVISKAAYLASIGTIGTNMPLDRFNGCRLRGIGLFRVTQILFYTVFNSASRIANFNEFYNAVDMGCYLLVNDYAANKYSINYDDCLQLRTAMQAVLLDKPPSATSQNKCNPHFLIPTCASGFHPYDVTLDGEVDGSDFLKWQNGNGYVGCGHRADANRDCVVDGQDEKLIMSNYGVIGTPTPVASPGPVF